MSCAPGPIPRYPTLVQRGSCINGVPSVCRKRRLFSHMQPCTIPSGSVYCSVTPSSLGPSTIVMPDSRLMPRAALTLRVDDRMRSMSQSCCNWSAVAFLSGAFSSWSPSTFYVARFFFLLVGRFLRSSPALASANSSSQVVLATSALETKSL
jgi:hypothetical protein